MSRFEIWSEGYAATGGGSGAHFHGIGYGKTFKEACVSFMNNDKDNQFFNKDSMTYWGCRLFENQADARKSFG